MSFGLLQVFVEFGNLLGTSNYRRVTVQEYLTLVPSYGKRNQNRRPPMDSIKDLVQRSVKVPEFNKYLKKAGGHISWNIMEITIKMKTIVWKPLMIKEKFVILLCIIDFHFYIIAIKRDLVSLLRFPFHSHVYVFSCVILQICCLKYLYSCFSSHFCFLVLVVFLLFCCQGSCWPL